MLSLISIAFAVFAIGVAARSVEVSRALGYTPVTPNLGLDPAINRKLGTYSPWFPSGTYSAPPDGCTLSQVNLLQRHGARYPNDGPSGNIQEALAKLKASGVTFKGNANWGFIDGYTYNLGLSDLVPFGAAQSYDAGQEAFVRYGGLINASSLPFVRASGSDRVVFTANNWTAGFATASQNQLKPMVSVVISETGKDPLQDGQCPAAGNSDDATDAWVDTFGKPAAKKLTAAAQAAAKAAGSKTLPVELKKKDWQSLISLCAFDTVASQRASPWCKLFTADDFAGYQYRSDLDKYYGLGYGQKLGPVQGVGYVNELIARLTNTPVKDQTTTNSTLDSSPATFPLGRAFYADFSHDDLMVGVFSALGLRRPKTDLDPQKQDTSGAFISSTITPFSARLVTERLECAAASGRPKGTYVRLLLNDALEPLAFCGSGNGLCELSAFVKSQAYSQSNGNGDWDKCFE